ncbi:MAG: glycerophosphodiester phosphodiesterase family protein [Clostridia bacterium]|nr:glycerophosphodiester phosphodiesterase family protein [Clostridia bacterium]
MFDLRTSIKEKGMLVTAHRGVNGGNIPCNSMECYLIAYNQGADVIEMDVTASKDGELFMLHPGMEKVHSTITDKSLGEMSAKEIRTHNLLNQDLVYTQYKFATFGDVLDKLKGKCYINVDKFWDNPERIAYEIRKRDMQDQVIVKSDPNNGKIMDAIERYAPDMQFLSIISSPEKSCHYELNNRNINYVGAEVLFDNDEHYFASDEFISKMHGENKVVWGNSIVYFYKAILAANHTDDVALLGDPDCGWGFFGEKGFDIVQTDFVLACKTYLKEKGYIR